VKRLPGARASGEELLARLLGVGALIALSTAVVAGCVNVYVQPAPTTGGFVPLGTPFRPASPRPRITGQPGPTPVSSFTFTGTGPGEVTAALGEGSFWVTLTVTGTPAGEWGWCSLSFERSAGPELMLKVDPGNKAHSASARMQYVPEYFSKPPDNWEISLEAMRWPMVTLLVRGLCPAWEVRGERKG